MKGKSFRPSPPPGHPGLWVRIVSDVRDSTLDRFIPIEQAEPLINSGELAPIIVGRAYPNSYKRT